MTTQQLWRVWVLANGDETALTHTPTDYQNARLHMRMKAIDNARRLGWRLTSQGLDFVIFRMPGGAEYELRIRAEQTEPTDRYAVHTAAVCGGIEELNDYTVDSDITPTDTTIYGRMDHDHENHGGRVTVTAAGVQ